jgi:hypothetical protein
MVSTPPRWAGPASPMADVIIAFGMLLTQQVGDARIWAVLGK